MKFKPGFQRTRIRMCSDRLHSARSLVVAQVGAAWVIARVQQSVCGRSDQELRDMNLLIERELNR